MESRIGVKLAGLTLAFGVAAGLSACSSIPDWVDPTTWIGGSDSKSASDDSGLSKTGQEAENQQAAGQTPDLADVPAKPAATDQTQDANVESSLAADRSRANYSADALRGGTEAAAPPPPASAPTDQQVAEVSTTPSAQPAAADDENAAPPASDAAQAAPAQPAAAAPPPSSEQASSVPGTLPDEAAPAPAPAAAAPAPAPVAEAPQQPAAAPPPETQVASNEPAPAAAPSVAPAMEAPVAPAPQAVPQAPQRPATDALGFAPSSAPPLDASVAQFVPSGVVNRYQQTQMASIAPVYGYSSLSAGTVGTRAAVVTFAGDRTVLDDNARALVKSAANAFRLRGGMGFVRVVGHASSRSMEVSAERHMELDFDHSQARATAVAQALIKAGVPADKVLVEAVGDTAPVRAMGGDADRSAEIFIQG